MSQKQAAESFLKLAGMGKVKKAFSTYIADQFIHHNQYFEGSKESLANAMQEAHETDPNKAIEIKHSYQDGNTVITHSLVVKESLEIAVVHICKFKDEKIIELWDLGQVIEKNSPNENGLF